MCWKAQIALMHRVLVEEKRWIDEQTYLGALSFCMLLPGPEATQLATYVGWRLHGTKGGLAAGLLFVLPGAVVVLALAMIYAAFGNVPLVEALFFGIKSAVLVIVIEALLRIAKRTLKSRSLWWLAAASFIAIFFFGAPFPVIVLLAAVFGFSTLSQTTTAQPSAAPRFPPGQALHTTLVIALWLAIWFAPLFAVAIVFGTGHILTEIGIFFSKLAVVTFGGAYAVLAYMAQDVVAKFGWLDARAMMDGLGLAETTPGPLILVTEFVGYLSAYRHAGGNAMAMGLLGAMIALWATFAPCFLWIFAGAPYIEWLTAQPRLRGALSAITAAVVGVILNLAVWFALHVFFAQVELTPYGPLQLWVPVPSSVSLAAIGLTMFSAYLLLYRHLSLLTVLAAAGLASLGIRALGI